MRRATLTGLVVGLMASFALPVAADELSDFEAARRSYDKQSYGKAVKWYSKAAEQGHMKAGRSLRAMEEKARREAAKPPPSAPKGYRIQLSAVRSQAVAAKEAKRLTRVHKSVLGNLEVAPVRADLGKRGVYYRLRAGPLSGRAAAVSLCRKLSARKQACIVIKP